MAVRRSGGWSSPEGPSSSEAEAVGSPGAEGGARKRRRRLLETNNTRNTHKQTRTLHQKTILHNKHPHSDHCQHLARGGTVKEVMAELMGKRDGASRGVGGSMHM